VDEAGVHEVDAGADTKPCWQSRQKVELALEKVLAGQLKQVEAPVWKEKRPPGQAGQLMAPGLAWKLPARQAMQADWATKFWKEP
jgi:hypothetical protein